MKLHVINNEKKKLQCVFHTLAIKNEALERGYKGGLLGFLDKHGGQSNGKITVLCFMGSDIDETIDDLIENGLMFTEDFEYIDAGCYSFADPERRAYPHNVRLRADWLKGRFAGGYIYVWYNDNHQEDA